MPKQKIVLQFFHGGLNTNSDPRDIGDIDLASATDIMVDSIGRIRTMGTTVAHDAPNASGINGITPTLVAGRGLFQFSHDRMGAENASAFFGEHDAGDHSTVMTDSSEVFIADKLIGGIIYNDTDGSSGVITDNDATTVTVAALVGGEGNSWDTSGDDDYHISMPETGDDYLALFDDATQQVWIYSRDRDNFDDTYTSNNNGVIDIGTGSGAKPVFYAMDGALRISDASFNPLNTNKWYGYIKRNHFEGPGFPYIDRYDGWYSADQGIISPTAGLVGSDTSLLFGSAETSDGNSLEADGFFVVIDSDGSTETTITAAQMADQQVLNITDGEAAAITASSISINTAEHATMTATWATEDVFMVFPQAGAGFNVLVSVDEGTSGWNDGVYEIASTFIYDGDQESLPFPLASTFTISGIYDLPTFTIWAASPYSPRITGGRLYYRIAGSPDYWKLLVDINMEEGVRNGLFDTYDAWTAVSVPATTWDNTHSHWEGLDDATDDTGDRWEDMSSPAFHATFTAAGTYLQAQLQVINPELVNTFDLLSGLSQEEMTIEAKFATAVTANRMTYIGNVQTKNCDNETVVLGDAIIKSPPNKVDTFPLDRIIEVSVRDGDEIVKLETYADRLLQFKKTKLEILNISQEIEFLEDTYMHKGVLHPAAVCKTDFGIAWVNKLGCYLYDGQRVTNLLERDNMQIIAESEWETFITANSMIGYVPKKRQLIVVKDCTATSLGDLYLYDIVTKSWVEGDSKFTDSQIQTNFVTDWNNDLVHVYTSGTGGFAKWSDTSVASATYSFKTKDIDFGQPSSKKSIYKVAISYKGDGSSVTVKYGVNGETDASDLFAFDSANLANKSSTENLETWHLAELKPGTPSQSRNIYSFQLVFGSSAGLTFAINDISITYRMK